MIVIFCSLSVVTVGVRNRATLKAGGVTRRSTAEMGLTRFTAHVLMDLLHVVLIQTRDLLSVSI